MKRLFLSGVAVNALVILINLATGILSARYLGPYERGELAAVNRWGYVLQVLLTLGLPNALVYLGKLDKRKESGYVGAYLTVGVAIGIVGLGVAEAALLIASHGQPTHMTAMIAVSLVSLPLLVLNGGMLSVFKMVGDFRKVMIIRVLVPAGVLLQIAGLIALGRYHVFPFIVVNTVWGVLYSLLMLVWMLRLIRPSLRGLRANSRELMGSGVKIFGTSMTTVVGSNVDQLLMSLLLSPYALGLYTVAVSVSDMVPTIVIGALSIYFWPKLMDMQETERVKQVEQSHGALFFGSLACSVVIGLLMPFAIPLVYGGDFRSSASIAELLLLGTPFIIGHTVLTNFLSTKGRFHTCTLSEVIGLAAGLGVMALTLKSYAGFGAALAVLTATVTKWLFLTVISRREGLTIRNLFRIDPAAWNEVISWSVIRAAVRKRIRKDPVKAAAGGES